MYTQAAVLVYTQVEMLVFPMARPLKPPSVAQPAPAVQPPKRDVAWESRSAIQFMNKNVNTHQSQDAEHLLRRPVLATPSRDADLLRKVSIM